jgi:hypothetical protein
VTRGKTNTVVEFLSEHTADPIFYETVYQGSGSDDVIEIPLHIAAKWKKARAKASRNKTLNREEAMATLLAAQRILNTSKHTEGKTPSVRDALRDTGVIDVNKLRASFADLAVL